MSCKPSGTLAVAGAESASHHLWSPDRAGVRCERCPALVSLDAVSSWWALRFGVDWRANGLSTVAVEARYAALSTALKARSVRLRWAP